MEVVRHWRLRKQRYSLVGEECPYCEVKIFPPRDICPRCGHGTLKNNLQMRVGEERIDQGEKIAQGEKLLLESRAGVEPA